MIRVALFLFLFAGSITAAEERDLIPRSAIFSAPMFEMRVGSQGRIAFGSSAIGLPSINKIATIPGFSGQTDLKFDERGQTLDVRSSLNPNILLVIRKMKGNQVLFGFNVTNGSSTILTPQGERYLSVARLSDRYPNEALLLSEDDKTLKYLRVNVVGGKIVDSIILPTFKSVYFDAEFKPVVATRQRADLGFDLYRFHENEWEVFRTFSADHTNIDGRRNRGVKQVLGVDDQGKTVYVIDNAKRDTSALLAIHLDTMTETVLAEDSDADILTDALLNPGTGEPLVVYTHFEELRAYGLTPAAKEVLRKSRDQFGVAVHVLDVSPDLTAWVVRPADGRPSQDYIFTPADGEFTPVPARFPKMDGYGLGTRKGHVVETRDGLRLPIHIYLPSGADSDGDGIPDNPLPTIFYVHGGPSAVTTWDHWDGRNVRCQQLFANRGYAAIRVEVRGTGGLGTATLEAGYAEWGGKSLDDLEDIALWAVEAGIAQRDRLGIWGFSYGGHAALAALTLKPDLFTCGVSWSAVASLLNKNEDFAGTVYEEIVVQEVGDPSTPEGLRKLKSQSALEHVGSLNSPVLLFHGGRDHLRPEKHSGAFAKRAQELKKAATYILYPKETHSFAQASNWISLLAITEHFFAKHLGGRAEPYKRDLKNGRAFTIKVGREHVPGLNPTLQ